MNIDALIFLYLLFVKFVAVTHKHDKLIKALQLSPATLAQISSVFRKTNHLCKVHF